MNKRINTKKDFINLKYTLSLMFIILIFALFKHMFGVWFPPFDIPGLWRGLDWQEPYQTQYLHKQQSSNPFIHPSIYLFIHPTRQPIVALIITISRTETKYVHFSKQTVKITSSALKNVYSNIMQSTIKKANFI